MSVDSYIAGPNGEMDWMVWNWDDKLKNYVFELTEPVDTIILGRKMTDGFVSYWSGDDKDMPSCEYSIESRFLIYYLKMIESPTDYNNNTVYVRMGIATQPTTCQIMRRQKSELFENVSPPYDAIC